METLSAHSTHDIGIAQAVRQHLEMHQAKSPTSGSMPRDAYITVPRAVTIDSEHSQSQSQASGNSTSHGGIRSNPSTQTDITRLSPPVSSQDRDRDEKSRQGDASQVDSRLHTPEDQPQSNEGAVASPARHKRTASGILKAVGSPDMRPRAESVSSSGSKAGEAAVQLKTRLAYAMAKVQHGWEHRNINEVEQLAAALPPRTTASSPTMNPPNSIHSPPAKRRSGSGFVSWSLPNPNQPQIEMYSLQEDTNTKTQRRSPSSSHIPSTPKSRPPPLRPITQQAEQDAMDALMLMGGSPGNGGKFPPLSQTSSSSQQQPFQSQTGKDSTSGHLLSPRRSESVTETAPIEATSQKSPRRLGSIGRSHSSASDVSVAASEVREARERILDEAEDAA